jgi:hypothetical protein
LVSVAEHLGPVRGQEREHAARRDQVPGHHPRVQWPAICPFETLQGTIMPCIRTQYMFNLP